MKTSKIILIISLILALGIFVVVFFTNDSEKKLKILDCEASYSIPKSKDIDYSVYSEINLQSAVGICLCEKYVKSKDVKYKKEILNLFENYKAITIIPDAIYKNPRYKVDSICKYKNMVFATGIEL